MNYNQVGLLFDMFGVLILFRYGLPSDYSDSPTGYYLLVNERPEEELKKQEAKNKFIKRMAYIGLLCLLLGFVLQFIGSIK